MHGHMTVALNQENFEELRVIRREMWSSSWRLYYKGGC